MRSDRSHRWSPAIQASPATCDVLHELRRTLEIPKRTGYAGVAQIGAQREHVRRDTFARVGTSFQSADGHRMSKIMEPQPARLSLTGQSRVGAQSLEQPVDGGIAELGPVQRQEEMIIIAGNALAAFKITGQRRHGTLMQRDQTTLVELRLAHHPAMIRSTVAGSR